jgi:hypothetical protein
MKLWDLLKEVVEEPALKAARRGLEAKDRSLALRYLNKKIKPGTPEYEAGKEAAGRLNALEASKQISEPERIKQAGTEQKASADAGKEEEIKKKMLELAKKNAGPTTSAFTQKDPTASGIKAGVKGK